MIKMINYIYNWWEYTRIKYINPDIYNEYKACVNLDGINDYINNTKDKQINYHIFQIVYSVNSIANGEKGYIHYKKLMDSWKVLK